MAPVYMVSVATAAVITGGVTVLLVWRLNLSVLISYLLAINATTLLAYAYDKGIAGGERQRVPERVLHGLALVGGTPAALTGQLVLRHKTRKSSFRIWFWVIVAPQVLAIGAWLWSSSR